MESRYIVSQAEFLAGPVRAKGKAKRRNIRKSRRASKSNGGSPLVNRVGQTVAMTALVVATLLLATHSKKSTRLTSQSTVAVAQKASY